MAATHIRIGRVQKELEDLNQEMLAAQQQYKAHSENPIIAQFWYGQFIALKTRTDRWKENFGLEVHDAIHL